MPDLSVVIVNYKTRDLLRNCLQSLQDSNGIELEVIVVDNASGDGSAEMVASEFPQVMLLAQAENTWYCGGNNIGLDASSADYVLLLNPDTVVASDALVLLWSFLRDHPQYAGVTAQLHYPDGNVQQTCSKIPSYESLLINYTPLGIIMPAYKRRINDDIWYTGWQRDTNHEVEVIPGSCTLMRRQDIRYDDDLRLYFPEDTLAQQQTAPFYFLAEAHIAHHEKSATQSWLATDIFYQDMFIYTRKHHGILAMLLLWILSLPLYAGMWLKRHIT